MQYFQLIKKDETKLEEVLNYFNDEYELAREEIKIKGRLNKCIAELPSLFEIRFSQLQELEAILAYFNNKLNGLRGSIYRQLQEHSKRQLNSTDIKQYVDSDEKVLAMQTIINEIALVRNNMPISVKQDTSDLTFDPEYNFKEKEQLDITETNNNLLT